MEPSTPAEVSQPALQKDPGQSTYLDAQEAATSLQPCSVIRIPLGVHFAALVQDAVEAEAEVEAEPFLNAPLLEESSGAAGPSAQVGEPGVVRTSAAPQQHAHERRARKRRKLNQVQGHSVRPKAKRALVEAAKSIKVELQMATLPVASCGYRALGYKSPPLEGETLELGRLLKEGYSYVPWDGQKPRPMLDEDDRVSAVLAGRPQNPNYLVSADLAFRAMCEEQRHVNFTKDEQRHKRGLFPAVNVGVARGPGSTHPSSLNPHPEMTERLLGSPHIQNLASFASSCFRLWAPRLYNYYHSEIHEKLFKHPKGRHLRRIFPGSVFPTAAFNFGPQVCTLPHRDLMNLPFGWCSIQALGNFDHTTGGHLVLEDLRMVIEFPPGSLILIPSATLTHGNIPVREGETRASFTQYCPGGVFRYVDNGFATEGEFKRADPAAYKAMMAKKTSRWQEGLALFSKMHELVT